MLPIVTQQHNYHYLEHVTCVIYTGIRCSVAPLSHQLHVVFFSAKTEEKALSSTYVCRYGDTKCLMTIQTQH